jgi:predicted phospho-2-dehydro-3-deoxyheptonate aldolase
MYGKKLRLARIINHDSQKICLVPIDHGTTLGPIDGIKDYLKIIAQVIAGGADGLVLHKGLLKNIANYPELAGGRYLLHLSASTMLNSDPDYKILVSSVEEAVKLGADGVSVHVNLGTAMDGKMIDDFGNVTRACLEWGMPLLAMVYNRNPVQRPAHIAHMARLAEELGADIVKVEYPGSMAEAQNIVDCVRIPVVFAGGSKMDNPGELLMMVHDLLAAGAAGVAIGRNIFQYHDPRFMTTLISKLVHGELNLRECLDILEEEAHLRI